MISDKTRALLQSLQSTSGEPFPVLVEGVSMNPTLWEGDTVLAVRQPDYEPGDILVFDYGKEGILIHRLLIVAHGLYHMRGDNAVRIERVSLKRIYGKVISFADGRPVPLRPENQWQGPAPD